MLPQKPAISQSPLLFSIVSTQNQTK
uniref:Uncharacterized protein n=1 Tax=Rhizophora mucronata TaxID=61149 RepID=A0A2P2QE70_RHIMU